MGTLEQASISRRGHRRASLLGQAAALLFAVVLPIGTQARVDLRDDRGALVVLRAPPQRIVSLLPSLTESVCALGGCDRLVGTDRFSNWPASVAGLPKLGGIDDAQIERIVALRPDAVLVSPSARVTDRLEALGLKVLVVESRNAADVQRSLTLLGQMLGTPAEAHRVAAVCDRVTLMVAGVELAVKGPR